MPSRLGRYLLLRPLGGGGMGSVYEAWHEPLQRKVALKVIRHDLRNHPDQVERFRRELVAAGKLNHDPHVILATDGGEEDGLLFLAMELVEGLNLRQLLQRQGGPLTVAEACAIIQQAAQGLSAIHRLNLVHRDLKPNNLMLTPEGMVKILDLGVARLCDHDDLMDLTPEACILGTLDYQAPEQASDPHGVNIRADIYSLGCTLFALFMGYPPYRGHRTPAAKMHAHAVEPLPTLEVHVPRGLNEVLWRMTAKDPAERYADPEEVVQALEPFAGGSDVKGLFIEASKAAVPADEVAVSPSTVPVAGLTPDTATSAVSIRRRRRVWWLAAVGVFLLVSLLGLGLSQAVFLPRSVEAAGQDRNLDILTPNEQHDLLERFPPRVLWQQEEAGAFCKYDPKLAFLSIKASAITLVQFGVVSRPHYSLRVQIKQERWQSDVGLFLGYHAEDPTRFQYLKFTDFTTDQGRRYHIDRKLATIAKEGDRMFCATDGLRARTDVTNVVAGIPPLLTEQVLELTVKNHRLYEVRLNGVLLRELTGPAVNDRFQPGDFQGSVGVYSQRNSCVIRKAYFRLLTK
jgi:hypothetical protein